MRKVITLIVLSAALLGCGISSNANGWSAGVGFCTGGWSLGSCPQSVPAPATATAKHK